jgi:crotonobetainyl-CoA:carnitine CoA-transferase CaiB-like acyl-CoA transferase
MTADKPVASPLSGIVVADFSELLPGPFVTQSLVDLGAEVIKIERPPHGDNARRIGPGTFEAVNRGKQSILADLKRVEDRERVKALICQADVLIESYRPGVMARLGLDYASLQERAPHLIYASLTGFGQEGPHALLPGHDINYLAAAGVLSISGEHPGPPAQSLGLPVADLAGAMAALSSILAALYQRSHTGRGQYLDIAIVDSVLHWMNPRLGLFAHSGTSDPTSQRALLHSKPAYGIFRCADNNYVTVAALEDHFWLKLNAELGLFNEDADALAGFAQRTAAADLINRRLQDKLATLNSEYVIKRLQQADLPVFPILSAEQAIAYACARPTHPVIDTPSGARIRFPVQLAGTDQVAVAPCLLNGAEERAIN